MFLEIKNNLIKIVDIFRIRTTESGVTILEIKDSEPLRILDSDKKKYKKIIEKIQSEWTVIKID